MEASQSHRLSEALGQRILVVGLTSQQDLNLSHKHPKKYVHNCSQSGVKAADANRLKHTGAPSVVN